MEEDSGGGREGSTSDEPGAGSGRPLPVEAVLELDHVFEALAHPRRRYLCYTLLEDREWSLDELATKVAAWEDGVPEHEVTPRRREQVYVSLYHGHVPKLVEVRTVTFDEETETISAAENAEQVLAALESMGASLDVAQEAHARSEMDDEGA